MDPVEYNRLFELEDYYWWFVARRKLVIALINRAMTHFQNDKVILDAGCGTGRMIGDLSGLGKVFGIDTSLYALNFCLARGMKNLIASGLERLAVKADTFDVVTALDVFEHITEDEAAIAEVFRVCKPSGYLLATVPAYNFLWSGHDEALNHKRRYTASELKRKLEAAGFKIEKISYVITFFFFPVFLLRRLEKLLGQSKRQTSLIILPKLLNRLLIFILDIETWLLKFVNLPFGVSIVCVAKKEKGVILSPKGEESKVC